VTFGDSARAYWSWAWRTPQAAAWEALGGFEPLIARRATLEDDLASRASDAGLDWGEVAELGSFAEVRRLVASVAALATGRLQILKEMRELDDRLGLSPKGLQSLRWSVVDDSPDLTVEDVPNLDDFRVRYGS